jgi:hypothetical protein
MLGSHFDLVDDGMSNIRNLAATTSANLLVSVVPRALIAMLGKNAFGFLIGALRPSRGNPPGNSLSIRHRTPKKAWSLRHRGRARSFGFSGPALGCFKTCSQFHGLNMPWTLVALLLGYFFREAWLR